MASTMQYDMKRKREKKRESEREQVRENALKFMKVHRVLLDVGLNVSPQTELNALESYVEKLQELREELNQKWAFIPEFRRVSWWLDHEISTALEEIVKLEIQLVSEGRKHE